MPTSCFAERLRIFSRQEHRQKVRRAPALSLYVAATTSYFPWIKATMRRLIPQRLREHGSSAPPFQLVATPSKIAAPSLLPHGKNSPSTRRGDQISPRGTPLVSPSPQAKSFSLRPELRGASIRS